jgi:hypothetical protein
MCFAVRPDGLGKLLNSITLWSLVTEIFQLVPKHVLEIKITRLETPLNIKRLSSAILPTQDMK